MRTTDLFKSNRAADKITESIEKVFGKKLNLESFDLAQLEDARNKLRTQIHTVRSESGFNENLENDAFTQAQWMLDAINSEIAERQEFISDPGVAALDEAPADVYEMEYMFTGDDGETGDGTITYEVVDGEVDPTSLKGYCEGDGNNKLNDDWCTEMVQPGGYEHEEALAAAQEDYAEQSGNDDEGGETDDNYAMASAGFGSDEDYESIQQEGALDELHADLNDKFNELAPGIKKYKDKEGASRLYNELVAIAKQHDGGAQELKSMLNGARNRAHMEYDTNPGGFENWFWFLPLGDDNNEAIEFESAPPTAKGERMVKHVKKGYAKDGKLTDKEKGIAYATAWKQHNKDKNESVDNPGEDMTKLREGEVQQATAVVTAKTMVDRVGRWIEELSGMENDQLIQLGDSIRDEMGQEQAKAFISTVAPAVQQALENLKTTRETLATGVRMLTGEEQGAELLGTDPAPEAGGIDDLAGPAEPDALNAEPEMGDEFAAAEPAVGGAETAGREKRESINYQNSLLKVLAG
jgi:hypothetical protein